MCVCAKSTPPSSLPLRRRDAPTDRALEVPPSRALWRVSLFSLRRKQACLLSLSSSSSSSILRKKAPTATARGQFLIVAVFNAECRSRFLFHQQWILLRRRSGVPDPCRRRRAFSLSLSLPTCPVLPDFLFDRIPPPSLLTVLRGRGWLRCGGRIVGGLSARASERWLARAQSAFLKGFSPASPLVPLVPPRRATLADAAAERGASRRPCRRRPPTRRAQGPIALLHTPHTRTHSPSKRERGGQRNASLSCFSHKEDERGREGKGGGRKAVAEAVDLVVYGVEVERFEEGRNRGERGRETQREGGRASFAK